MDLLICALLGFGRWTGGELVLESLGLVIDTHPGNLILFRSNILSHFNLDFDGFRSTLVCQVDISLPRYFNIPFDRT